MKFNFASKTSCPVLREQKKRKSIAGHSFTELVMVLLIMAVLAVIALPSLLSSRRLFSYYATKQNVVSFLREARQKAMSEQVVITFRYDDYSQSIKLYGGSFGGEGDDKNRQISLVGNGLNSDDLVYDKPSGAPSTLPDGSSMTAVAASEVEVVFQPNGSVIDASRNPSSKALFFYDTNDPEGSACAISVVGAGGRVKLWKYNATTNQYEE